jgi:hypothetical protein
MRNAYRISVGNPEKKGPFGRHRHRLEDNIKTDFKEIGYEGWTVFNWLMDTMVGSCKHGNESSGSINDGDFLD